MDRNSHPIHRGSGAGRGGVAAGAAAGGLIGGQKNASKQSGPRPSRGYPPSAFEGGWWSPGGALSRREGVKGQERVGGLLVRTDRTAGPAASRGAAGLSDGAWQGYRRRSRSVGIAAAVATVRRSRRARADHGPSRRPGRRSGTWRRISPTSEPDPACRSGNGLPAR